MTISLGVVMDQGKGLFRVTELFSQNYYGNGWLISKGLSIKFLLSNDIAPTKQLKRFPELKH